MEGNPIFFQLCLFLFQIFKPINDPPNLEGQFDLSKIAQRHKKGLKEYLHHYCAGQVFMCGKKFFLLKK